MGQAPAGSSPLTTPHEPPHPVLQAAGLNMGVQQLNQKVQALTEAHQSAFLSPPTPGLVLDVLKSGIDQKQYPTLFSIPKNQQDKQAQTAVALHKQANPDDYFVQSPLAAQPDNPFYRMIRQSAALPNDPVFTIPGKHPGLVTTGNIDIANRPVVHNPDGSISTVRSISIGVQGKEVLIPTVVNGKVVSNQAAIAHYQQTGENLGSFNSIPAANAYAEALHNQQAKQYLPQRNSLAQLQTKYPMVEMGALPIPGANVLNDAMKYLSAQGPQAMQTGLNPVYEEKHAQSFQNYQTHGGSLLMDVGAVKTIQAAKQQLAEASGIDFSPGPVFNQDDAQKVANWMKSTSYFKTQLAYQAKNADQSVAQYVKSWNAKWGKGSPVHNGLIGHFMSVLPQQLWGHGGGWSDLLSLPSYIKGSSNNPLNIGLHGLGRTAGLTLNVVGGTVSQLKADAAAGTTYASYVAGLHGTHWTYEQALEKSREQLRANPTWMRLLAGGYLPADSTKEGSLLRIIDQATNVAGDLILLRKPGFTGERVAAADLAGAMRSDHLNATAGWAYNDLATYGRDGIGRASSRLDGGQGARELVARTAKLVQDGKMSQNEFTRKVAELYSQGETTVGEKTVTGPLLSALRTDKLPTPGTLGRGWIQAKGGIRDYLDRFNANATDKHLPGSQTAVSLTQTLRTGVAHAAPEGAKLGYFQRELPEQVFNFVRKYKLADDPGANQIESMLVRYQGTENVQGIQDLEQKLHSLWDEKFPGKVNPLDDPFRAKLSTETPSIFHFPGQADPKLDTAMDSVTQAAKETNKFLNKAAKIHARVILSGLNPITGLGGFSLFWKHLVGDGLRAYQAGVGALLNPETKRALGEVERLAQTDPAVERQLGSFLDRVRVGETRWALNKSAGLSENFRTGDHLLPEGSVGNVFRKKNYLTAAGGYLRRHLTAPELQGYRDDNLVQVILNDREARAAWKSNQAVDPNLTADEYAGLVSKEYADIEQALQAHGLTFDDALNAMRAGRGHEADAVLGKFVQQHQLDFTVRGGLVEQASPFDELTSRWVGNVIMRPNKMWRTSLGRAVLGTHYSALRKAGWSEQNALNVSMDTAEQVVKFHMLDFANRLQVEQDLRWVSYFATKHRLYFKWVLSTFMRHPQYAAAVADFQQTLNSQGGWTLPVSAFGLKWQIPLERLVWVPGHEYDETSPLADAALAFAKSGGDLAALGKSLEGGGNAPTLGRSDIAVRYGTKLLKIEAGNAPATYGYAAAGLSKQNRDAVFKAINQYQQEYFKTHGHYAPESQAVKLILRDQMAQQYWQANLPLPVTPVTGQTDEQQKLMNQYMGLIDPKARAQFLDNHKGFSDQFGIYENPAAKIHNDSLFRVWNTALDGYRQARAQLFAEAKQHGTWTEALEIQRRQLTAALEKTRQKLLIQDAKSSGIDTRGLVPNGDTVPYGPWGKLVNKDPTFDPSHFLSTLFPKLATNQDNTIGPLQRSMQHELSLLNDPTYVQGSLYTPDEVKTRKNEILQALDVFKSYPADALGVVRDTYQSKYVNTYWSAYDKRLNAINALPSDQKQTADATFRAWRDSQDHPVTVDGVVFPSPLRMAWAVMDPATRQQRLSYLASKPLSDVADYELDLLGVKHPPNVSTALSAIEKASQEYRQKNNATVGKAQLLQVAKQIDKQAGYHGFYAYYVNTLTQPRVRQFEATNIYRDMPAQIKSKFDQVIGQPALELVNRIKQDKNQSYYGSQWRKAMEQQITPWLNDPANSDLRAYLSPMGANFLNTLVSSG